MDTPFGEGSNDGNNNDQLALIALVVALVVGLVLIFTGHPAIGGVIVALAIILYLYYRYKNKAN